METNYNKQYLTFFAEGEKFAIRAGYVREILERGNISKVPGFKDYMAGIINNRGTGIPVMDFRKRIGFSGTENRENPVVIVTEMALDDKEYTAGLLTDSVEEVIVLNESDIDPPPAILGTIDRSLVRGIGKINNELLIILDIENLLLDSLYCRNEKERTKGKIVRDRD